MNNNIFTTIYTKPHVSNLPSPTQRFIIAKKDTGATDHYIPEDVAPLVLSNIRKSTVPVTVTLPDKTQLTSTKEGDLPLDPAFTPHARIAKIVPKLRTPLLSTGKLADDNTISIFTHNYVYVIKMMK